MTDFAVLIVAAGTGSRAGTGVPKQYRKLQGRAVLRRTIEVFQACPDVKTIQIVIHKDHQDYYREAVMGLSLPAPVLGGSSRTESVAKGLRALAGSPDTMPVLIHDAARPFITRDIILQCVEKLKTAQAVTVAIPVTDTIRKGREVLGDTVDRENLWSVQTPQGFQYGVIARAHETLSGDYSDDSQMVSALGIPVAIVEGRHDNIKLTREEDFQTMQRTITKTGLGYDVHAFGEQAASIRIGGIDVPHTRKLAGHSDADVVLHAITDAIYGTIASGDIGSHFPPSDMQFKNMDSAHFLKLAVEELRTANGEIVHIDTVIICEEPKVGPHRDKMREAIAKICGLPLSAISVKATTSEKLGFTGRGEGIACQALVTVQIDA